MAAMPADQLFEKSFLSVRCLLLDLASSLDRIDRADGSEAVADEENYKLIQQGIEILASGDIDRAERLQMLFSDQYDSEWVEKYAAQ